MCSFSTGVCVTHRLCLKALCGRRVFGMMWNPLNPISVCKLLIKHVSVLYRKAGSQKKIHLKSACF